MSRHLENDQVTQAPESQGVDREHLMRDVMQPSDKHLQALNDQFHAFSDYYNGYLVERVSRLAQSEYGRDFIESLKEQAGKGEPLHTMLLASLQQRQLIPQA